MTNRHGHSLVELLATLATLAVLAAIAGGLFRLASRTAHLAADRAEALDATRTTAALLGRELRPLGIGDVAAFVDSIPLRAFRGYAIPCDTIPPLRMRFTGARPPDPTKDSVLALTDSIEYAAALTTAVAAAANAACAPLAGEQIVTVATNPALPPAAVWLLYEAGTYSIGGGALRYRRGFGGRQPVTAPSFDDPASQFTIDTATAAIRMLLAPARARVNSHALPAAARVPLLNTDTLETP